MKITIAYLPAEEAEATADLAGLLLRHPGAKVRKSDRHPPFKHIYVTNRKPGIPHNSKRNTCTIPPDMV